MLAQLKLLVFGGASPADAARSGADPVAAAAAALMIEAAVMDGHFDDDERTTVSCLLAERFDLDGDEVAALIAETEAAVESAVELFSFTRVLRDDFDHDQRIAMVEMLWEVSYADGVLHDYEANLIRRVNGLLHVGDRESGAARKRVLERLDNEAGAA